ncbi:quinone oxidoreductase family protein [Amantichitinum ursilacus]|uniref:Phthiocerol synthesis polyketide synthase type I PpsC n=1 Tax=Amantichitinum ursilacus TaxID=857265 RepID=A0A0N0XJZ2_9NEIS|nr:zinc-binding alcohol dehydrogenase family protein [Amantichitinum ursilacus]KPC54191.1 Phthiocerol synthesis polyketide synthase type I PpsC [Amantichitinum ursilacus]
MKAAVVTTLGQPPVYQDFDLPSAAPGQQRVRVTASALSQLARAKALGKHYSSSNSLPLVAGVDGVGVLENGQRVYFFGPIAPGGALAEYTLVPAENCVPLPDDLDDVTAAAIAIPGMSCWAALVERAQFVQGETVLVNGATGASGRLAVQVARHLGARKIIATGRNPAALAWLRSAGADVTVTLDQSEDALSQALAPHFAAGVDVVLDYLWGASARAALISAAQSLPDGKPLRFVQIGSISAAEISLPAAVLRSTAISLLGSGIGSVPLPRLLHVVAQVLQATVPAQLQVNAEAVPLAQLAEYWDRADSQLRTVFVPG